MKTPKVSIIVAISKNRGIGNDNKLLWQIPDDLRRFKKLTTGHLIIMGRKTFESIGKALPERDNIVITRDKNFETEDCIVVNSLEQALAKAASIDNNEIFIIGGGQIYEQAISKADKIYLTEIDSDLDADTFFPDYSQFNSVVFAQQNVFNGINYKFLELERSSDAKS